MILDFDAVRIARTHFMQGDQVRGNQAQQHQGDGNHMEREETIQGGVGNDVITTYPQRQIRADERNGAKQVHNNLCAPIGHLPPWQQVTEKRLAHQAQENADAEQPDQFPRLAIRAVQQATRHVQVDDDKECRSASGVHVTHKPTPRHVTHDRGFNRGERQACIRLVMHDQENAGDNLDHQHQHRQRAEDVPEIEIFRRVVLTPLIIPQLGQRKTGINPIQRLGGDRGIRGKFLFDKCHDQASPFSSLPISILVSDR